jgi:cell division protein FtsB
VIDPGIAFNAAALVIAGVIGAVAGGRRGVSLMASKADAETQRLIAAQSARLELLERENASLKLKVADLEAQMTEMRHELDIERRITARFFAVEEIS